MTKEVKLRICGMHMHGEDGDRDDVEVISVGQMCERDGLPMRKLWKRKKMDLSPL